jgi:hypothetical protein
LKALSKQPEDRFSSAAEFGAAIEQAVTPAPSPPLPQSWLQTERMDVSAFSGMGPRGRRAFPTAKTEPLDVSGFRGVLQRRAPLPEPPASMLARAAAPANGPVFEAPARSLPVDMRRLSGQMLGPHAVKILVITVLIAAALLALLCTLTRYR